MNNGINEYVSLDKKCMLKQINLGVRALQKCRNKQNGDKPVFRMTQEGLQSLFPYFTERKVQVPLSSLLYLLNNQNIRHQDVPASETVLQDIIKDPRMGYFALYVENEKREIIEVATLVKFTGSLILMSSDETIQGLRIKYEGDFTEIETKLRPNPPKKKQTSADDMQEE